MLHRGQGRSHKSVPDPSPGCPANARVTALLSARPETASGGRPRHYVRITVRSSYRLVCCNGSAIRDSDGAVTAGKAVTELSGGAHRHRTVATSLQRSATTFRAGLPDPGAVRSESVRPHPRSPSSHVIRGPKKQGRSLFPDGKRERRHHCLASQSGMRSAPHLQDRPPRSSPAQRMNKTGCSNHPRLIKPIGSIRP